MEARCNIRFLQSCSTRGSKTADDVLSEIREEVDIAMESYDLTESSLERCILLYTSQLMC